MFVHLFYFCFRPVLCMPPTKGSKDHLCFLSLVEFSVGRDRGRMPVQLVQIARDLGPPGRWWMEGCRTEPVHWALCWHETFPFPGCHCKHSEAWGWGGVRWTQRRRKVKPEKEASFSSGVGSPTCTFAFPWPKERPSINESTNKVMIPSSTCSSVPQISPFKDRLFSLNTLMS